MVHEDSEILSKHACFGAWWYTITYSFLKYRQLFTDADFIFSWKLCINVYSEGRNVAVHPDRIGNGLSSGPAQQETVNQSKTLT